jgi:hypothetical protein
MGLWKPRPRRVVERLRSAESFPGSVGSSVAEPFLLDEPVAALPLVERRRQTFEEALRNGYDEFLKQRVGMRMGRMATWSDESLLRRPP